MTIYKVIRRYIYGTEPYEVRDTEEGLFKTEQGAERYVKRILYKATKVEDVFFDKWVSEAVKNTEYHIIPVVVLD